MDTDVTAAPTRWIVDDVAERADDGWHLVGSRCGSCATSWFPHKAICARCLDTDLERVHLPTTGRIDQATIVHLAPPGFEAPYILAWVELDDGPRVFGRVIPATADVATGTPVRVDVAPIRHDATGAILGHVFVVDTEQTS